MPARYVRVDGLVTNLANPSGPTMEVADASRGGGVLVRGLEGKTYLDKAGLAHIGCHVIQRI